MGEYSRCYLCLTEKKATTELPGTHCIQPTSGACLGFQQQFSSKDDHCQSALYTIFEEATVFKWGILFPFPCLLFEWTRVTQNVFKDQQTCFLPYEVPVDSIDVRSCSLLLFLSYSYLTLTLADHAVHLDLWGITTHIVYDVKQSWNFYIRSTNLLTWRMIDIGNGEGGAKIIRFYRTGESIYWNLNLDISGYCSWLFG